MGGVFCKRAISYSWCGCVAALAMHDSALHVPWRVFVGLCRPQSPPQTCPPTPPPSAASGPHPSQIIEHAPYPNRVVPIHYKVARSGTLSPAAVAAGALNITWVDRSLWVPRCGAPLALTRAQQHVLYRARATIL